MDHANAKHPSAMELENLIYESALNRALILILLQELEKSNPDLTERVQEVLNLEPQRVYGLVSQFVEVPSPYYEQLLKMRKEYDTADKVGEALKNILNQPPKSDSENLQ